MNRPILVLLAFLLTACSTSRPSPDEARSEIEARSAAFSAAYVAGDIDRLLDFYTTDGMAAAGTRDFVRGRAELRRLWTLPEGRTVLRHRSAPVEIVVDGDHAYDWGYYEGQAAHDGRPLEPFRGKYLIVWERGDDGLWRMAADIWTRLD